LCSTRKIFDLNGKRSVSGITLRRLQQGAENRIRIKARKTTPDYSAMHIDNCGKAAITNNC
jgi:hypothetical protein